MTVGESNTVDVYLKPKGRSEAESNDLGSFNNFNIRAHFIIKLSA